MVVNIANVFSESRDQVVSLLKSNITDPKTGQTNSRRRWFYREFPDTTSRNFGGYPIIVVSSPELEDDIQDLQNCLSDGELNLSIGIFVEFNDNDARVDEISNAVYGTLRSLSNRATLLAANIDVGNINAGPFDNQDEDGKRLSTREFTVPFNSTLQ